MSIQQQGSPFLGQVRHATRVRHYSIRTEVPCLGWRKLFILFHGNRRPRDLGEAEVGAFHSYMALDGKVAAATQNPALNAPVFFYKMVLEQPLAEIEGVVPAKKPQRLPVVLTVEEVRVVLRHLSGVYWLVVCPLYRSGLRLLGAVRLRVEDLDFDDRAILERDGKGAEDRVMPLPDRLTGPLRQHLEHVQLLHDKNLADGLGAIYRAYALERQYPKAPCAWPQQYAVPSGSRSVDLERRHHLGESSIQKAVRVAVRKTGVQKLASCHTLRDSFAPHLPELGMNIRPVQEQLGHRGVRTTQINTHVLLRASRTVFSPLNALLRE